MYDKSEAKKESKGKPYFMKTGKVKGGNRRTSDVEKHCEQVGADKSGGKIQKNEESVNTRCLRKMVTPKAHRNAFAKYGRKMDRSRKSEGKLQRPTNWSRTT